MSNQDIESFIWNHQSAFEDREPNPAIWLEVEKTLRPPQTAFFRIRKTIAVAATILLPIIGGLTYSIYENRQSGNQQDSVYAIAPELKEIENHYESLFKEGYQVLVKDGVEDQLAADFVELDRTITSLKSELLGAPPGKSTDIIKDLIDSYRLKIKMLERILQHTPPDSSKREKLVEDEEIII